MQGQGAVVIVDCDSTELGMDDTTCDGQRERKGGTEEPNRCTEEKLHRPPLCTLLLVPFIRSYTNNGTTPEEGISGAAMTVVMDMGTSTRLRANRKMSAPEKSNATLCPCRLRCPVCSSLTLYATCTTLRDVYFHLYRVRSK